MSDENDVMDPVEPEDEDILLKKPIPMGDDDVVDEDEDSVGDDDDFSADGME